METEIPALNDQETVETERSSGNYRRQCRRGTTYQIIACFIANTSVLGPAMGLGYSAVALGPLGSTESEIKVTESQLSWIASITAIATPIGCILSSITMRRGRRFGMIATSVTSAIGWFIIYLSHDVTHILIGRGISGIAMGLASVPATVYAAEVASPKLRGIVVTWTSVSIAIGILIVYTFGFIFQTNWRLISLLCGLFPLTSMILVATRMPESPVWLRSVGRESAAEKKWKKFNGLKKLRKSLAVDDNLLNPSSTDVEIQIVAEKKSDNRSSGRAVSIFTRENFHPFLIMLGYFFFQQFSGIFVVVYYAVDFTIEAGLEIDGYLGAILLGATRLLGTIMVSYISRKYGRRIPSIASGTGMTIFMGILSIYLWLKKLGYDLNDGGIIPVLSLLMYILTSTMGFLVLPFAMIGELYPARLKDVFSGMTTCFAYIFSFVVLKIYPDMLKSFDKHGVFFFYCIISLIGTIFVVFFLPETKGRTLQEIEESFKKTNKTMKNNKFPNNFNSINYDEVIEIKSKDEREKIIENQTKISTIRKEATDV